MSTRRYVIAGGTGFIGRHLAAGLVARGDLVTVLSRRPGQTDLRGVEVVGWDGRGPGAWTEVLAGASGLINLCGRSVDCRKTPDHCDEILRSRTETTMALGRALAACQRPPPVWVQMSTAHIYGDPPLDVVDEDSALGYGLAPEVGRAWEAVCAEADLPDVRRVFLRTSFVLGRSGGALQRLVRLARWRLGGAIGHGRQGISWIHEYDLRALILQALDDPTWSGVYNATAPAPVANRQFMQALRRALGIRLGLPAAAWMVRIGAPLLLRTDPELALYGRYCVSRRLPAVGFTFAHPELDEALESLLRSNA